MYPRATPLNTNLTTDDELAITLRYPLNSPRPAPQPIDGTIFLDSSDDIADVNQSGVPVAIGPNARGAAVVGLSRSSFTEAAAARAIPSPWLAPTTRSLAAPPGHDQRVQFVAGQSGGADLITDFTASDRISWSATARTRRDLALGTQGQVGGSTIVRLSGNHDNYPVRSCQPEFVQRPE